MAEQIRVGVIGTSWYADLMHLPILQSDPQANTVAICGRNRDRRQEQKLILHGSEGTLEVDYGLGIGYAMRGARYDEEAIKPLIIPDDFLKAADSSRPFMEQVLGSFQEQLIGTRLFVDAIIKDRPLSPNFRDGLKVQQVMDAAIESDRQGCWVSLPRA